MQIPGAELPPPPAPGERARLFPITARQVFLAHAGVSPLSGPAAAAVEAEACNACVMQQETGYREALQQARESAGALFGVRPDEVSLLGPTSLGLSLVAAGIDWRTGDELVYYPEDYPANVYPWRNLERRGVRLVALEPAEPGEITADMVRAALTARTRLVALASVHFLSGYRIDVDAIGRAAHEAGALFCLDSIQSLGALRTPMEHVDFAPADSHKWMLGPLAMGVFIVRAHARGRLRPALLGAENVATRRYLASDEIAFPDHASRYEPGVMNMLGVAGMRASLDLLREAGLAAVEARVVGLRERAAAALRAAGCEILGNACGATASGIITFRREGVEMRRVFERLLAEGIAASHRWTRDGRDWIRFSPHYYIYEEEIDRAVGMAVAA